ncbi:MAG: cadherin-like beta sandwich domain-containing protein, partial [Wenzhouxiangellaceae bacterium]
MSNLTVSEGSLDPAFSSVQTNYAVTVGNDVASVTVSATTTDDAASVGINGEAPSTGSGSASLDLPVGDTSVSVDVTAEDGSTETYSIVITREASSDSTLSDLSLSAANLNEPFDSATIQYTADVSSETDSTTVTATTSDSAAAITVNGTATASGSPSGDITLDEGDNSIVIEVTGEDGSTTTYTVTVTRAAAPVTTALQVTVLDDAGALVLGASVNVNGLPLAVTAADGRATVDVDPGTTVTIGVSRSGHVPQTRQYDIPPAAAEAVVIMAISRLAEPVTMPAAENGGTAAGSAGASVELPAGALVDSTGQPVTGSVDVFLTPIDVMDERQLRSFPGDFAGTDASGAEVYIASLGMVDFEFAQDGEPLELGTGQTAQIRIPIYTQERSDGIAWAAGDTVPLWSLDPATGLWLEEALGTIIADAASPTGLVLEGTVSHFSPWNADVPLSRRQPLTTLQVNVSCGSIGSPCEGDSIVPEISLRVSNSSPRSPRFSRSFILSVSSTTEMRVPANVNLDLEARGGFNAFAADVTPTQVNLSLGGERSVDVLVRPLHEAGGEFTPGLRLRGAMETVGETHSYFFDGQADEVFSMTAYAAEGLFATIGLTGELGGRVTLFDPAGNELATDVFDAFQTADLNTLLSEAGRYEVRFIAEGKV